MFSLPRHYRRSVRVRGSKEGKWLAQGPMTGVQREQDLNPDLSFGHWPPYCATFLSPLKTGLLSGHWASLTFFSFFFFIFKIVFI